MSDRRQSEPLRRRRAGFPWDHRDLSMTVDASRGSSNLATVPRAGNISTDTRAGSAG